jgi:hypothetical protein
VTDSSASARPPTRQEPRRRQRRLRRRTRRTADRTPQFGGQVSQAGQLACSASPGGSVSRQTCSTMPAWSLAGPGDPRHGAGGQGTRRALAKTPRPGEATRGSGPSPTGTGSLPALGSRLRPTGELRPEPKPPLRSRHTRMSSGTILGGRSGDPSWFRSPRGCTSTLRKPQEWASTPTTRWPLP